MTNGGNTAMAIVATTSTDDKLTKAFARVPLCILEAALRTLNPRDFRVFAAMYFHCRSRRLDVWPGLARVVELTGLSRNTVLRALKSLVAQGFLTVTKRGGRGTGDRTVYRIGVEHFKGATLNDESRVPNTTF